MKKKAKLQKKMRSELLPQPPPSPLLLESTPEKTWKKNQEWFSEVAKTVKPGSVVEPPAPAPAVAVIPGFPVRCICMTSQSAFGYVNPDVQCKSCGGKGFMVVSRG